MQDKWAALLANAANPDVTPHPGFVQLLSNMSPLDVRFLDDVYKRMLEQLHEHPFPGNTRFVVLEDDNGDILRWVGGDERAAAADNIRRLGLLHPVPVDLDKTDWRPMCRYYVTDLGMTFYLACQPPAFRTKLLTRL